MAMPLTDPDRAAPHRRMGAPAVSTTTCVHEALAHLRRTGEQAAVVYRNGRPVGVVTAAALARARTSSRRDVPLAAVMDYVAVPVDAHADTLEIVRRFSQAAWDWLRHRRPTSAATN